jgi:hypothetical protein
VFEITAGEELHKFPFSCCFPREDPLLHDVLPSAVVGKKKNLIVVEVIFENRQDRKTM